ncbi:hypothetical protein RJ55_00955 [Drechmeria coniospora]|nr:hypothetical protein RJ55_00955 [Drechmeria coniospora]
MASGASSAEHVPQRAASPSTSFYALSDDEEGGYNTVTQVETGRGVKLLFSKSKVYVHPTPSAKDNIPGYIALLQQKRPRDDRPTSSSSRHSQPPVSADLLLAWVPESALGDSASVYVKVDLSDGDSPPKQSYLVPPPPTVTTHSGSVGGYSFAIPMSAVYSLLVRPPSLGWWYGSVIINSRAGDSFPALFFHDNECESTVLQKRKLTKDNFDPFGDDGQTFWGADEVLRWLRRYITLERSTAEPNIYLVEPTSEDRTAFGAIPAPAATAARGKGGNAGSSSRDAEMDPFVKLVKETGWNLMNHLSKVTTFTRRAAQDFAENSNMPPQVKRLLRNPEVQTLQDEFDSARIYLARWAMGIAEQSERDRRGRFWTARDLMELEDTDVGEFELLEGATSLSLDERRRPVTMEEWRKFFDAESGRLLVTVDEVKERIFHGGLDADDGVRQEAWLFLLGVHEKDVHRTDRNVPLFQGEDTPHPDPSSPFAEVGTNVHLEQMKEMLLTYNEYNKDLGYVQGMSDLLAPIYAVIQDDAIAFWAFQKFMERMERNFLRDQSGMRAQLLALDHLVQFMDPKLWNHLESADSTNFFFFFRMVLVWYKREFGWMDVLRLWEGLWTDYLTAEFPLFVALAILEKHRDVIMDHLKAFDEVLKYVNELSSTIDLESTLIRAEALFRRFQRLVEAVDKKQNFPPPRVVERSGSPSAAQPAATSSSPASRQGTAATAKGKEPNEPERRVITPELRKLLSRKVEVLPRKASVQGGEAGMPTG